MSVTLTSQQWCSRGGTQGNTPLFHQIFLGTAVPPNIFGGNAIPSNDIRTRGPGDTVAFPQIVLQRNAMSMVIVHSSFIYYSEMLNFVYRNLP